MLTLRPNQQRAIAMLKEHRSPVLVAPAGYGKTAVACQMALDIGGPSVIVTHAIDLVSQTADRFRDYGLPCGVLGAGFRPRNETAVSASIQTLTRMRDMPDAFLVIVDEAHRACGASYQGVLARYREHGARIVFLTATPERLDGMGLGLVGADAIVEPTTYEELFEEGTLLMPEVWAPSSPNLAGTHIVAGDFSPSDSETRITGDLTKEFREKCPGGIGLVFSATVKHGLQLAGQFYDNGFKVLALDGKVPIGKRRDAVKKLGQHEYDVLITCGLFGEGFDLPELNAVIMARMTLSYTLFHQQAMRCARSAPGKKMAVLLDHAGNAVRHGLPWWPRKYSLHGRTIVKKNAQRAKRCPQCFAVYAIGPAACPQCGFVAPVESRTVEHAEGALVRFQGVLPSVADAVEIARTIAPGDSRAVAYVMMARKAWEKGYKPGWAEGLFRRKFGCSVPSGWGRMNDAVRQGRERDSA